MEQPKPIFNRKGFRHNFGGFNGVKCGWNQYTNYKPSVKVDESEVDIKKDNVPESENANVEAQKEIDEPQQ